MEERQTRGRILRRKKGQAERDRAKEETQREAYQRKGRMKGRQVRRSM
jgi:hypothetical protein